jgi:hypothetical protein
MRFKLSLAFLAGATLLLGSLALANESAESAPKCEKRKLVFSDDFPGNALDKGWTTPKGTWTVEDGMLKGVEKAEDHHAAVVRHELKIHNLIAEFSFRFDGGKTLAFSLNNQKGHVCRVAITPTMISLAKDKPNPNSPEKGEAIAKEKTDLKSGEWHTMLVTVCGKHMAVSLDGKHLAGGENEGVDVEKTSFGFPVLGDGASIKQVKIWDAVPAEGAK